MKKIIAIIFFALVCTRVAFAGSNTRISGTVLNAKDSTLNVTMIICDAFKLSDTETESQIKTTTGKFDFRFYINKPTAIRLRINNKLVFFPGVYEILVEPGDDIHISIPEMKKAGYFGFGITNLDLSGRGSEKLIFTKNMVDAMLKIFATDIKYKDQSLAYKYETSDRKLNAIDSIYYNYKGKVAPKAKDIIRAQLYDAVLDMLFVSSTKSESDSLRLLFSKYILAKKRMDVFFKDDVIYYYGRLVLPNYILLAEFENPVYTGGEQFRLNKRLNLAKIALKHVKNNAIVRDYLLSNLTYALVEEQYDSPDVQALYKLYKEKADAGNPFFNQVVLSFEQTQKNLTRGVPFYNFSLPDPTGKIHRLADFKGKVLVFDFWFNGCFGCKSMASVIEELEREYEGEKVQFLSVGTDKKADWLNGIGKFCSKNSLQLYTEEQGFKHPFIKHLNFSAYPRLIVVDKDGKMVGTPPNPLLDKQSFKKFINKYL
ncbi:thiol-disulfide isomerase/thioredoxin [Pedobacter africanus]|uniref:Thiol-disulfide isomerase/thioredoxin n=1 Tax=Pedobacter africanus TaxID=151894 RepID=A0ACC6KUD4_9SPHI|nr:thioredoxin-like domain-containing protein [Pedobacter africanus]MDR6782738.1 thiol-disulfide isomerase/thioredoxin [Pedobacter africanus]